MPALFKYWRTAATILSKVFIVLLALLFELAIIDFLSEAVFGRSHGMIAGAQYRRAERLTAYREYHQHPSPESKAILQTELRLMHAHEDWKGETSLFLLLTANGIGFYFYFRRVPK